LGVLQWVVVYEIVKRRKGISSEKIVLLHCMVAPVESLESRLDRPFRTGVHQEIAELVTFVVVEAVVLSAASVESIKDVDGLAVQARRRLGKVTPILEAGLMNDGFRENRRFPHLVFGIVNKVIRGAIL